MLARLTAEFPDLTPSKLRFLEERQLISPARTESGYRKFSAADLDRLRFVLTMQREHYLPLKVIRGYLDELDAGRQPELPGRATLAPASILSSERRLQRDELIREAGASPQLLNDAVSSSLIAAGRVVRRGRLSPCCAPSPSCSVRGSSRDICADSAHPPNANSASSRAR